MLPTKITLQPIAEAAAEAAEQRVINGTYAEDHVTGPSAKADSKILDLRVGIATIVSSSGRRRCEPAVIDARQRLKLIPSFHGEVRNKSQELEFSAIAFKQPARQERQISAPYIGSASQTAPSSASQRLLADTG